MRSPVSQARAQAWPSRLPHVDDLARIFLFVFAHEAAEDSHGYPAVPAAFRHDLGERPVHPALKEPLPAFLLGTLRRFDPR
jgi:hypothetical protein